MYGWAGGCTACGSEPGARGALALPASLLTWAAAPGKLRVLRLSRCAAPAPSSLQVWEGKQHACVHHACMFRAMSCLPCTASMCVCVYIHAGVS